MEQLSDMPPYAWGVFAFTLAIIFGVRHFGLLQGARTDVPSSPAGAQVAAVIVDPTALNNATRAVEANTMATLRLADAEDRRAKAEEHMAQELDRIREEMRIQREVRR